MAGVFLQLSAKGGGVCVVVLAVVAAAAAAARGPAGGCGSGPPHHQVYAYGHRQSRGQVSPSPRGWVPFLLFPHRLYIGEEAKRGAAQQVREVGLRWNTGAAGRVWPRHTQSSEQRIT